MPAGAKLTILPVLYDPAATGSVFAANWGITISYKTTDGKNRCQTRQVQASPYTSVYFMALQQFEGINMAAYYKYIFNPLYLAPEAWPGEYGCKYPELGDRDQLNEYMTQVFGQA